MHRIKKLESDLQIALFVRDPSGLVLTEAGRKVLQYCRSQSQIEEEFLQKLMEQNIDSLTGALRIGSVSSLAWSVLTPSIAELVRDNPEIHVEMIAREVSELPLLLKRGRCDYLITIDRLEDSAFEEHALGIEKYVLIEPTQQNYRKDVYLDHDEGDKFTSEFFSLQGWKEKRITRSYMDDNHGLLAGVRAGLGRAVVPLHLLKGQTGIRIVKKLKSLEKRVYLYYFKQPDYSKLHDAIVKILLENPAKYLNLPVSRSFN